MTIDELRFEIRKGDEVNGNKVTKVKSTFVETEGGKFCFAENRYPRVKTVSRNGKIYYKLSPHGGKRR